MTFSEARMSVTESAGSPGTATRHGIAGARGLEAVPAMTEGRRAVWAFDVDGCLIDSMTGTSLRPAALDVLRLLKESGAVVILWSAGGRHHAASRAAGLGFADFIDAIYSKEERGSDGRWACSNMLPEHQPDVFVDDWPDEAPLAPRLIAVPTYLSPDELDCGLEAILAELTSDRQARRAGQA
jgi:hypothetical protein